MKANLKEVIISITNRCNLKCRMCDIPINKAEELDCSLWKRVIKDAVSLGAETVVFSGGEPLLREDIFELISFTKDNSLAACLTSNGLLIDDAVAEKLNKAGVDVVNISVEGPKPIHDYLRGKGMFERAVAGIEALQRNNIETTIATTVSKYNYEQLSYVIELAKEYKVTTVKFQPFSMIFLNAPTDSGHFFIQEREINNLTRVLQEAVSKCSDYAIATNPAAYLIKVPVYLAKKYSDTNEACPALDTSCPINCNGDVFPCWTLAASAAAIGNIREDSLLNVWKSPKRSVVIAKIKQQGCSGCLMSCYDKNFFTVEQRISTNLKLLQKKGLREYSRGILRRLIGRIRFYSSYRGNVRSWLLRFRGFFRKKALSHYKIKNKGVSELLKEIEQAKQAIENEIRCLK